MSRRVTRRQAEHERDLPAGSSSGDHRDRRGDDLRLGDVLLRQGEARAADQEAPLVRRNADARGDQRVKPGPSKGKAGR